MNTKGPDDDKGDDEDDDDRCSITGSRGLNYQLT